MEISSRTHICCAAIGEQSWSYRYGLLKKGDPESKKVDPHFVLDHPGIYRHFQDGIYWKPSHDGLWHVHVSNYKVQRRSHVEVKYVFAEIDDPAMAVILLVTKVFKVANHCVGHVIYPQPLTALSCIQRIKSMGITEHITSKMLRYDRNYPSGPDMECVIKELEENLTKTPPPADLDSVDKEILSAFDKNLKHALLTGDEEVRKRTGTNKLGACCYQDVGEVLRYRYSSLRMQRQKDSQLMDRELTIAVGLLPKIGATTSSGKCRRIFPMSLGIELAQRQLFGDTSKVEFEGVTRVKGPKFPALPYTYDITNCDQLLYHYVKVLIGDDPWLQSVLLPCIYTRNGVRYSAQYPSGVYSTTIVTECLTAAIAQVCGQHAYIQGDGIMTAHPIEHRHLRSEPRYTINGFRYRCDGPPVYTNGEKRLTSPRLTNSKADSDWELRRQLYITVLNARESTLPPSKKGSPYADLSGKEIAQLAQEKGQCRRLLRYAGVNFDPNVSSGWDAAPTDPVSFHDYTVTGTPAVLAQHCRNQLLL